MTRVTFRWLLPFGHLLIDCILLLALISYSKLEFQPKKSAAYAPASIPAALLLQGSGAVEWDVRIEDYREPAALIMSGNLVPGLISSSLRPHGGFVDRNHAWDPVWFLLQE